MPFGITISTYNEWGEGTQIESSKPHVSADGEVYQDFGPQPDDFYIQRTKVLPPSPCRFD